MFQIIRNIVNASALTENSNMPQVAMPDDAFNKYTSNLKYLVNGMVTTDTNKIYAQHAIGRTNTIGSPGFVRFSGITNQGRDWGSYVDIPYELGQVITAPLDQSPNNYSNSAIFGKLTQEQFIPICIVDVWNLSNFNINPDGTWKDNDSVNVQTAIVSNQVTVGEMATTHQVAQIYDNLETGNVEINWSQTFKYSSTNDFIKQLTINDARKSVLRQINCLRWFTDKYTTLETAVDIADFGLYDYNGSIYSEAFKGDADLVNNLFSIEQE